MFELIRLVLATLVVAARSRRRLVVENLLLRQQLQVALGAPVELFVEGLQRVLEFRDGGARLRPAPDGIRAEIYAGLDNVDMFGINREIRCPLLLFNAVNPDVGASALPGPPWIVS